MEVRLWSVVAESEAVTLAGPDAEILKNQHTLLAAGRDTVVVIAERGVRTSEDLVVSGPFPARIAARLTAEPHPHVLALARLPEGCLALGAARVIRVGRRRGALQDLELFLEAPLPYDLLDRVRPTVPPPEQPDLGWLDVLPTDPVAALEQFVTGWYADVPPHDVAVQPGPLRDFHRIAAGRPEVYDGALRIFTDAGTEADGTIIFGQERDGVFTLLTEDAEDPAVWYHGLSDQPLRERERLRTYLMIAALTHAAMDSSPGGMAFVDRDQAKRMVAPLRRVPLRPARWPCARSRIYAGPGMVVLVGDDEADWFEVYVGARHRSLLRRFRKLGLDWERFDG